MYIYIYAYIYIYYRMNCKAGHLLELFCTPNSNYSCDICSSAIPEGVMIMACNREECGSYDVCEKCAHEEIQVIYIYMYIYIY